MDRSYESEPERQQTVSEEPLEDPREIISKRDTVGTKATAKDMFWNLHERGIRQAGNRSLPLYALVAFISLLVGISFLAEADSVLAALLGLALFLALLVLWVLSPFIVYWDCKAGERYMGQSWTLGKAIAAVTILMPFIFLALHIAYRIRKFRIG